MTDNTPLNPDDELRKHCDSLGVPSLWYDKLIDIVEADRKRVALEARLDELLHLDDESIGTDWKANAWFSVSDRMAELKAQQEEV